MLRLFRIRTRIVILVLASVALGFACSAVFVPTSDLGRTYPYLALAGLAAFLAAILVARSITVPLADFETQTRLRLERGSDGVIKPRGRDELSGFAHVLNEYFIFVDDTVLALENSREKAVAEHSILSHEAGRVAEDLAFLCDAAVRLFEGDDRSLTASDLLALLNERLALEWSSIALLEGNERSDGGDSLVLVASEGLDPELAAMLQIGGDRRISYAPGQGLSGLALAEKRVQVAADGCRDKRFKLFGNGADYRRIRNACVVPMLDGDKAIGVLMAFNAEQPQGFHPGRVRMLESAARLLTGLFRISGGACSARRDRLTGLSGRTEWLEALKREIERSRRSGGALSVCRIEILFPSALPVDDRVELLGRVGRTIREEMRVNDSASRVGGRFDVLLPGTDAVGAMFFGGRVKERIDRLGVTDAGVAELFESVMGLASFPEEMDEPDGLMEAADRALKSARASGTPCLVGYGSLDPSGSMVDREAG